ncbi:MAG: peptidase [Proteobacteria bacterium]|nr:peptidase [Pseudomonadota bacterium]
MTYCLGITVREGLICLADGRVTSGSQVSIVRKVSLHGPADRRVCIMTSGLRSLRDKTIAYFDQEFCRESVTAENMHEVLAIYARSLRRVAEEDRDALEASDLYFDLHGIIAGQIEKDAKPTMFLVYPEGNWIEVTERTPHIAIGATAYGKPILDRMLTFDTPLPLALQTAYLAFDSTRVSTADVGFPLDMLTFARDRRWREMELDQDAVSGIRQWWNDHIKELATTMPEGPWADRLLPGAKTEHLSPVAAK